MRGGAHGRGDFFEIDAVVQASLVNAREFFSQRAGVEVRHVQIHAGSSRGAAFLDDITRDDVARSELRQLVIAIHETLAGGVAEIGSFAAQGFAEQKSRGIFHKKRRGVELDEFDVGDFGAVAIGDRHAIAGGDIRIGGVLEDAPQTSGGEQHGAGANGDCRSRGIVMDQDAADGSVFHQQIGDGFETLKADVVERSGAGTHGADQLAAGGIAMRVQHAITAVGSFAGKQELGSFAIESRSPFDELFDGGGSFFDQRADGRGIAQAVARGNGVGFVQADLVVIVHGGGDAALRVFGGRFAKAILRDDENPAGGGELQGGTEPSDTGPDDDEIGFHGRGESSWYNEGPRNFTLGCLAYT